MNDNSLPPYRIDTCIPERREPGLMVFNVRPGGKDKGRNKVGWIIGVNAEGEFPLNLQFDTAAQDSCAHPNGNLILSLTAAGQIKEVSHSGRVIREWHIVGKWLDKKPPANSIAIDVPLTHHRVNVLPNGNFLLLSAEMQTFSNWPVNDTDPHAPRGSAEVIGDIVLEVTPTGDIINKWHLFDMIDPYRLCYGSCSDYWHKLGFPNSNDWCHTNAIFYDKRDDTIMLSLRTQDCILKFTRSTGALKWILGDPGNWQSPWSEKLLKPVGDLEWQYHQHDCSITPAGTILCFDNGNHRALPFSQKLPAEENYSRVVEYVVDEKAMTVKQLWSFGDGNGKGEGLYGCYQGGAYRLPKTGNTFMNFGGVCTVNGVPTNDNRGDMCQARLLEVTPDKEIVFDMWIDGSNEEPPLPLSSFRAEHFSL